MSYDVLFVDDEPNVLAAIRRALRRRFDVDTASSPEEGLAKLKQHSYPVIVTDMRMPGMNGAEFLRRARTIQPHAVRMVLSGEASIDAAIRAVNDGSIFRYLRKPTEPEALVRGVREALDRFTREQSERDLLERTLTGAVETLAEVLQLAHPVAFRTTNRVVRIATELAEQVGLEPAWEIRVAASLVFIGCIAIADDELMEALVAEEPGEVFLRHAAVGEELLGRIPRLENVARMVGSHLVRPTMEELDAFDTLVPFRRGAIVLGIAVEADRLVTLGLTKGKVLMAMERRLNQRFLKALGKTRVEPTGEMDERTLKIDDLEVGMVAMEPIETVAGLKLVREKVELTKAMCTRIANFHHTVGCREPVRVAVPRP